MGTYVQENEEDYTQHEFETISNVKIKMYQKFNKDVSDLLNSIYDEKSGEELLPFFGKIVTAVYKMNLYFGFGS